MFTDLIVVVVVLTIFILIIGCLNAVRLLELRSNERFREKYPPISDEEFLRRCHKGVNPKIALRVRQIVSDQMGIDVECIYPELTFAELEEY